MKWMIASDLHGSYYYAQQLQQAFEREQTDRLLFLGDLLYHGPRNDLPRDYAPKKVIPLLNSLAPKLLCVRGNCDAEVDQMVLHFPILSDSALLVLDGSRELTAEDEAAIALANTVPHLIVAVNKSDLPRALDVGALADRFDNVLSVSAATGAGLDTLTDAIAAQFPAGESTGGALLTNARQADAANRALSAVAEARGALRIGMTPDVVLTDCEAALAALGELNGKQVRDDLVDTIFSRFCVGK